jgi:hypothetical protein
MSAEFQRDVEEKPKHDLTANLPKSEEAIESLTIQQLTQGAYNYLYMRNR